MSKPKMMTAGTRVVRVSEAAETLRPAERRGRIAEAAQEGSHEPVYVVRLDSGALLVNVPAHVIRKERADAKAADR